MDKKLVKAIARQLTDNMFCATGPGGGVDPSCGKGEGGDGGGGGYDAKRALKQVMSEGVKGSLVGASKAQAAEAKKLVRDHLSGKSKLTPEVLKKMDFGRLTVLHEAVHGPQEGVTDQTRARVIAGIKRGLEDKVSKSGR